MYEYMDQIYNFVNVYWWELHLEQYIKIMNYLSKVKQYQHIIHHSHTIIFFKDSNKHNIEQKG